MTDDTRNSVGVDISKGASRRPHGPVGQGRAILQ